MIFVIDQALWRTMTQNEPMSLNSGNKPAESVLALIWFAPVAAAILVPLSFFLPLSGEITDIAWVCCLCLTAAISVVALAAGNTSQLAGFSPLVFFATLFRMALNIAVTRLILGRQDLLENKSAGFIIDIAARPFLSLGPGWSLALAVLSVFAAIALVSAAGRVIKKSASRYINRILPLKHIGVETDLNTGLIDRRNASILIEKIRRETCLYLDMTGAARLLLYDMVIAGLAILVAAAAPFITETTANTPTAAVGLYMSYIAAQALLNLTCAVSIAVACAGMLDTNTLSLGSSTCPADRQQSEKLRVVVSSPTCQTETVELLNPDFVQVRQEFEAVISQPEQLATFEPATNGKPQEKTPQDTQRYVASDTNTTVNEHKNPCRNPEDYYSDIARQVMNMPPADRIVLFASESPALLPVTVAVNTAIKLAQKNIHVLLVDADSHRCTIAKAFDIDTVLSKTAPQPTWFANIRIWTHGLQAATGTTDSKKTDSFGKNLTGGFDRVIVYAPNISETAATYAPQAQRCVVFCQGSRQQKAITGIIRKYSPAACSITVVNPL